MNMQKIKDLVKKNCMIAAYTAGFIGGVVLTVMVRSKTTSIYYCGKVGEEIMKIDNVKVIKF